MWQIRLNAILIQSGLKNGLLGKTKKPQDMKESLANRLILKQHLFLLRMHKGTLTKSHIVDFFPIINNLDKIEVKIEMKMNHFYYCVLYLLHIRAIGKLSSMEANQLSRSMKSRSIYLRTKLTTS